MQELAASWPNFPITHESYHTIRMRRNSDFHFHHLDLAKSADFEVRSARSTNARKIKRLAVVRLTNSSEK